MKWAVLSADQQEAAAEYLRDQGAAVCLGPRGYEALSLGMADVLRYLQQASDLIRQYEKDRQAENQKAFERLRDALDDESSDE